MFDHPALELKSWCRPETQRVLIFREQLESLVKELSGRVEASDTYRVEAGTERCSPAMFYESLRPSYKESLSAREIKGFYRYIQSMFATSRPYVWCSTLVERAIAG